MRVTLGPERTGRPAAKTGVHGSDNIPGGIGCRPCAAPPSTTHWTVGAKANSFAEMIAGAGAEPRPGHPAARRHDRTPSGRRRATAATAYFPERARGSTRSRSSSSLEDEGSAVFLEFEGVYRDAQRAGERRPGRPPAGRLFGLHRPDRPSAALRRAQRGQGRGAGPRRQPVVLGRRHLPQRLAAPGRAGPPGARRPAGGHAGGRRRGGGGGGQRRGAEPVDRGRRAPSSAWRCSTPTARSSPGPRRR